MSVSRMVSMRVIISSHGLSDSADTTWTGAVSSEFGTAGNWDNGAPGSPETVAIIGNGDTVANTVDYAGASTYQLTINGGSTLNSSADFTSDRLTIGDGSTLNLTDGSYSLRKTSGSNNSQQIFFYGSGTLNISGGVHTFRERIVMWNGSSVFRITGSAATVRIHQQTSFSGTLEMIFDSVGISTYDSDSYIGFSGDLMVDATAYTGRSAKFVLVDNDNPGASAGFSGDVDITAPAGYSYVYDQSEVSSVGEITLELLESGTIVYDDFATDGLTSGYVLRDSGWRGHSDSWEWSSGQLMNTNTTRGVGRVVPVPAGLTTEQTLQLDLDYSFENGSTTLYVHLWGLKHVSSSAGSSVMNTDAVGGMWYQAGSDFDEYNLKDGSTSLGSTSTAALQIPGSEGVGQSYSGTVRLGSLGAGLSKVSDYDYIAIGFQKGSGSADLSIDYMSLRALKPKGTVISVR